MCQLWDCCTLTWDVDSQLYYARARWYDPSAGRFIGEDPLGFEGGDLNISRYANNDPVNLSDPTGLFSLGDLFDKGGDILGDALRDVRDFVVDAVYDTGDLFEEQWDNGNIQKGLLVAGTLASGGALAVGRLGPLGFAAGSLQFASGVVSSYEVFSGDQIGDGTFSRTLGASAAITGGFWGNLPGGSTGRSVSAASGLASGYEIATGSTMGDGTFSSILQVSNLGVNHGTALFSPGISPAQRISVGLNLSAGAASLAATGDPQLQRALRSISITTGLWNTATSIHQSVQTTQPLAARRIEAAQDPVRRKNIRGQVSLM